MQPVAVDDRRSIKTDLAMVEVDFGGKPSNRPGYLGHGYQQTHIEHLSPRQNQHRSTLSPYLCEPYLAPIHSALQASASDQKSSTVSGVRLYAARSDSASAARTAAETPCLAAAEMLTSSRRACSAKDSSREKVVRIVAIAADAIVN